MRPSPAALFGLLLTSSAFGSGRISTPYMWVSGKSGSTGMVARIDTASGRVTHFPVPAGVSGAVDAAGNLWLAGAETNKVYKVNAADGRYSTTDLVSPTAVAADGAGNVLVLNSAGSVSKLRGADGAVLWATAPGTVQGPFVIAVDASGCLWVPNANAGTVTKLDGISGSVIGTYPVGNYPEGAAVDASGVVWVSNTAGDSVIQLDSADGAVLGSSPVRGNPDGTAVDAAGNVWTANAVGNSATKLGPGGDVIGTYPAGPSPRGLSVDAAGRVWVMDGFADTVTELDGATGALIATIHTGLQTQGNFSGDLTGFAVQAFLTGRAPKRPRVERRASPIAYAPPLARAPSVQSPPPAAAAPSDVDALAERGAREHPDDFALIVGIDGYRSVPHAAFGENDASVFKRYAHGVLGVPEDNIILLLGAKASRTDVSKYLEEWLPKNVSKDSRVYFYYSGHGAPDPEKGTAYLVPWDGDPEFLQSSAYPLTRLYDQLAALDAKEVVVFLDSCFSGAGGRSLIAANLRPLVSVQESPRLGRKLSVLTAATGGEVAGSSDQKGHGLFTYYLLKGLQGAARPADGGPVDIEELSQYVGANVQKAAHRENREQHPKLTTSSPRLRLY